MRILITGSRGQVGNHLKTRLSNKVNFEVLALDKSELDITNQDSVRRVVEECRPNVIINVAAHTAVDKAESEIELSYAINRDGPKFLAQSAQSVGAALLHVSTDYVFEGNKIGTYSENDITNPQSVYGLSKLAGEVEVSRFCEKYIILRTSWVFSEYGNNFVKTILHLGSERDELAIVGDQFGGPTYAGDIAEALIKIVTKVNQDDEFQSGVYHFSGRPYVSWFEFASFILDKAASLQIIESKPLIKNISTENYPTPAKRPKNSKLSNEKINKIYSLEASDWKKALHSLNSYIG